MTGSPMLSVNFTKSKNPSESKLSYVDKEKSSDLEMLLFKDPKSSVWFTLGSEDETMFCDTSNYFLSSTAGQGFQNTK